MTSACRPKFSPHDQTAVMVLVKPSNKAPAAKLGLAG
jgi:hypothetical protein